MLLTNTTSTNLPRHYKNLCPRCGGTKLRIQASAVMSYEVVFDAALNELVVINAHINDTGWDEHSRVECPSCHWQGELKEGLKTES
jgi:Zn finger protein HypA/HybF involved in hydrogenase expression